MFEWIKSKWNATKKAVATGVRKVVAGVKRVAARVVSGVKKAVRSASTWVRNKYRGRTYTTTRTSSNRSRKWINTGWRNIKKAHHTIVRYTSPGAMVNPKRYASQERMNEDIGTRILKDLQENVILVVSTLIATMIVLDKYDEIMEPIPGYGIGIFPGGKGFRNVRGIGGDAVKGGSKAKNLYKAEGLLKMDLQLFGKETGKVVSSVKWKGFRKGELTTHYKKHVVEMGEFGKITQSQYMKMAKEYAAETSSAFKEGKVENFIIKYDPNTRRVLVGHCKSREIRTFYKADFRDHDPFQAAIELAKKLSGQ
ncbi:hypothetical protein ACFLKB_04805 [Clostridium sp. FAM 1755]|uniref:hypothetical protein n=1 Tax=Clostridium caseinilyticum TaxID=3350403 RepID=UPI0038F5EC5C